MQLYIFRHGETFANVEKIVSDGYSDKVQLTEKGKQQALQLGAELAVQKLPLIYVSPYDRARQTAELVASYHQTSIEILPDLHEFSFGVTEGWTEEKTFAEYQKFGTQIKMPYVVKPACDGSSVGVFIVKNAEDAQKVFYDEGDKEIIVEEDTRL